MFLRFLCYNFLKVNPEFDLNGISVETALQGEYANLTEYMENVVIANYEEAKTLILAILPIVLRHPINILVVDMQYDPSVKSIIMTVFLECN